MPMLPLQYLLPPSLVTKEGNAYSIEQEKQATRICTRPRGPILGASAEEAPISPPVARR